MEKIIIGIAAAAFILFIFLAEYLRQKKFFSSVDDNVLYVMKPSPIWLCYGIIDIIGYAVLVALFIIGSDKNMDKGTLAGFAFLYCFELLGVYLCIYWRFYKCVITTDSLIIYTPFFPVRKIKAREITSVKYKKERTAQPEKKFVIYRSISGIKKYVLLTVTQKALTCCIFFSTKTG